jgi:CheY-like chemotaxis protein
MPGRSGYDVAAHIRRSPHLAHIPVLLLTGAFEPIDRRRAAEVGCAGVLAKPFEPQIAVARVKELLARPVDLVVSSAREPAPPVDEPLSIGPPRPPVDPAALDQYFDRLQAAFAGPDAKPATAGQDAIDLCGPKEPDMSNPTPPLADAFAALLAAEQREPLSALPSTWPAGGGASAAIVDEAARRVLDQLNDKAVRETVTKVVSQVAERLVKEEIERIRGSIK